MRITIVTGPFLPTPPAPCGAVEMVWAGLAEQFVKMGHEVTIVCRLGEGQPREEKINGVRFIRKTKHMRTRRIWIDLLKDLIYSFQMLGQLPPADITVTNVFWLPILAKRFCKRAGQIYMHVARMPKGQMWLYRGIPRLSAVSHATGNAIAREQPRLASLLKVIPNPIDLRYFAPKADLTPPTAGSGQARSIMFTGRIHPEKGLHLLVEAFVRLHQEFPDLTLRLVGPWQVEQGGGGEAYLKQLRNLAGESPVVFEKAIHGRAELAQTLRSATYYCYPSLADKGETFGVAPLEAMACGVVPVVSTLDCFKEFLVSDQTGLFFNHHASNPVQTLVEALRRLIMNPSNTARMAANAVEMSRRFSIERVAAEYIDDFNAVLREQGKA